MTTINDVPICILKKILNNVNTKTQIQFSMTCKKYYDKLYPSRNSIGTLANNIFAIKSNKIRQFLLDGNGIENNTKYCHVCCKINYGGLKCCKCSLGCCVDCVSRQTTFSFSNVVCKKCDTCNNCSRKINAPIENVCGGCGYMICDECFNNITFKCCDNSILCNKCSSLCNYCKECKNPCCSDCVPSLEYMCGNH